METNLRLVKTASAVFSGTLDNQGAKPAQWALVDDKGATVFRIEGKYDGQRRYYTAFDQKTGLPVAYGALQRLVTDLITKHTKDQQEQHP